MRTTSLEAHSLEAEPVEQEESLLELYACPPEEEETLRRLLRLLAGAPVQAPLGERLAWLEGLLGWLRAGGAVPTQRGRLAPAEPAGSARLRLLAEVLAELPSDCEALREVVASVLAETRALELLTEPGLSGGRGLMGDAAIRLGRRLVPAAHDEHALATQVWRLFPDEESAAWLEELSDEHVLSLYTLLRGPAGDRTFAPLASAVDDAVSVLAARVSARGTASDVLARLPDAPLEHSPFLQLPRACEALRHAVREGARKGELERVRAACAETVASCRAAVHSVLAQMHESAVDSDLVYRLDQLVHSLDRLEALLWLRAPDRPRAAPRATVRLLSELVRARAQERSVTVLFRSSMRYVSRRIFEHTGEVGRHSITESKDEYRRLFSAAAGGGLLTAGTAALKVAISFAALPLFFDGLAASTNYALSFLLIQLLGFTLATKQPSMTAAALAATLDVKAGDKGLPGLVKQLARINRSQLASVFGNISAVVVTATVVGTALWALRGRPMMDAHEAEYVLRSLHPLESGTLLFAAFTGVLLWCSSVFGGWLENWVSYRRLPEALARHRGLQRLLGPDRARWLGEALGRNACGLGANVSLGLLLGMTPVVCRFFGLPLDVRHVTLGAGTLAFAGTSLGPERLLSPDFLWAVAGIGGVAVMNLTVSFALGLRASLGSRGMKPLGVLRLARAVLAGGLRSLSEFVLPPQRLLPARRPTSPYGVLSAERPRSAQRSSPDDVGPH